MSARKPGADLGTISLPSRRAEPGEGVTREELSLAARNHAIPAEALRWDITPPGLHYVLTHYDIPDADPATWVVTLTGAVEHELRLGLDDLAAMEQHTLRVTMECAGNGRTGVDPRPLSQPWITGAVGTAEWSGVRLKDLLEQAGTTDTAVDVVFRGADHGVERGVEQDYERGLPLSKALDPDLLIATAMNGMPLPPQHGFPVRLVVPGWYGMASVKWLQGIRVDEEPFEGFQHRAYRLRMNKDDAGTPVTQIEPRALLSPPGFPDFMSRRRVVESGRTEIRGRAWSGWGPVTRVEFSSDDGETWTDCRLDADRGTYAWRAFSVVWDAVPGLAHLRVRATDTTGRVQPLEPVPSLGGFTNNADEAVIALVR
jgi:DMSO/TMAO reductase YedYZ molybdopterin-dependent catalytic subunit